MMGTHPATKDFEKPLFHEKLTLDFGKNMSAYYSFSLTAQKGDSLKFYPREKSRVNRPFVYVCREGKNVFTTPQLNVFRYLDIEPVSGQGIKIDSIYAEYTSYPVNYAGSFACSNPFFTQLWDISRWTTQMCMNTLFFDSPMHQEPLACTGDYLIESLSNYYAFGDPWLARQDIIKTARMLRKNHYDMFHTSYSLLWVQMLDHYFQFSGDTLLVKELLPHVNQLNDLFATYLDEDYIVSQAPDYMFMDWIKIDKYNAHHPPAVIGMGYLTAFYYQSLIIAANFNSMINNESIYEKNLELAEKIKFGMNRWLWDEEKQLYKDGIAFRSQAKIHWWLPADEDVTTYSPHVNTLCVLYDIAPKNRHNSILNYVTRQKEIDLQPYFTYFVLSAISKTNHFDSDGLSLINKWKNGIDLETHTLKENWQDETEFGYRGDFSHAWGGSPLYFLSREILGIKSEKPGFDLVRFDPYVSDSLLWAKGTVPLDNSQTAMVSWSRVGNSTYSYKITIPDDHQLKIYSPEKLKTYKFQINNTEYSTEESPIGLPGGDYLIEYIKIDEK